MSEKITVTFAQDHGISRQAVAGPEDPKAVMPLGHPGCACIDCLEQIGTGFVVMGSQKTGPSDPVPGASASLVVCHTLCAMHVPR